MSDTDDTNAWKKFASGSGEVPPGSERSVLPFPGGNSEGVSIHVSDGDVKITPSVAGEEVTPAKWDWRIVLAWFVFVLYGIILEAYTLWDDNEGTPPLTWVTVRYVPEVIAIGFTSWLLYHFATEYWKKGAEND